MVGYSRRYQLLFIPPSRWNGWKVSKKDGKLFTSWLIIRSWMWCFLFRACHHDGGEASAPWKQSLIANRFASRYLVLLLLYFRRVLYWRTLFRSWKWSYWWQFDPHQCFHLYRYSRVAVVDLEFEYLIQWEGICILIQWDSLVHFTSLLNLGSAL